MNTIKETADGSLTLYNDKFDQYYHSIFGANQESQRVFMELGLLYALENFEEVRLFEMGFGTGLNAAMTWELVKKQEKKVSYLGLEGYPIGHEEFADLDASRQLLLELGWGITYDLSRNFTFEKVEGLLMEYETDRKFNLVYYDAFAPVSQPELWTQEAFEKIASLVEAGGILTTYCSKSYVRHNLKGAGFKVSKHSGPYRKREVLRAEKA